MKHCAILCVVLVTTAVWATADGQEQPPPQSVYYSAVPTEIAKDADQRIADFARARPVDADAKVKVQEAAGKLNPLAGTPQQYKEIRSFGEGAIPALAELLSSQDAKTRRRGLNAIMLFGKVREYITPEYAETERLLIAILRRALYDKSEEVRLGALWGLFGIALQRGPSVSPAIKDALQAAMDSDPSSRVRKDADYALQDLGLRPRDPSRKLVF